MARTLRWNQNYILDSEMVVQHEWKSQHNIQTFNQETLKKNFYQRWEEEETVADNRSRKPSKSSN